VVQPVDKANINDNKNIFFIAVIIIQSN
jgi:hypothetical protein